MCVCVYVCVCVCMCVCVRVCVQGEIQWCDEDMAQLCGYTSPQQISGLHMQQLIPAFLCPDPSQGLTKVWCSNADKDNECLPLS